MHNSRLKKLFAKIGLFAFAVSLLSPFTAALQPIAKADNGVLRVGVNIQQGGFTLYQLPANTPVPGGSGSGADCTLGNPCEFGIPAGFYKLVYHPVADFVNPTDTYVQVGSTAKEFFGRYSPTGVTTGSVTVSLNAANASYTIKDYTGAPVAGGTGNGLSCTTENPCEHGLPFGFYSITATQLSGFTGVPEETFFQLDANGFNFSANYQPVSGNTGALQVGVNNPLGSFTVTDSAGGVVASGSGDSCTTVTPCEFGLPTGFYNLNFSQIDGFVITPSRIPFALPTSGKSFTGTYVNNGENGRIIVNAYNRSGQSIDTLPADSWFVYACTSFFSTDCSYPPVASGGANITSPGQEVTAGTIYRLVLQSALPAGYLARTIVSETAQRLEPNGTVTFAVQYVEDAAKFRQLSATTQPVVGTVTINGTDYTPSAAGAYVPAGGVTIDLTQNNTIHFGDVANFDTPADIVIPANSLDFVSTAATLLFTGVYTAHTGTVAVNQTGLAAAWTLSGPNGFSQNGPGNYSNASADVGDYILTPATAAGYNLAVTNGAGTAVADNGDGTYTLTLTRNGDVAFNVAYTVQPGTVTVTQTGAPAGTGFTLTGPSGFTHTGTADFSQGGMTLGDYTLTPAAVANHDLAVTDGAGNAVADNGDGTYTLALTAGSSIAFAITYTAHPGSVHVTITGGTATYTLDGPAGFSHVDNTAFDQADAVFGVYTLTPGALVNFNVTVTGTGATLTVNGDGTYSMTLTAGSDITFAIAYAPQVQPDPAIIDKTATPLNPVPGQTVTYTVNYANNSADAAATDITITDNFPETLLEDIRALSDTTNCTIDTIGGVIRCEFDTLAPGATGTFSYQATVRASLLPGQTIVNAVVLSTLGQDSNAGNNSDSVTVTVAAPPAQADPYISDVSLDDLSPIPGQTLTTTVTYGNTSNAAATANTLIKDDYDQDLVTPVAQAGCTDDGDTFACAVPALGASATDVTFTYQMTVADDATPGDEIHSDVVISADVNAITANDSDANADVATVRAALGTVTLTQTGAQVGHSAVLVNGATLTTVESGIAYTNANAPAGVYTLAISDIPAGYRLASVQNSAGNTLAAPYTQTLTDGATIGYTVAFEPIPVGTITVTQTGALGTVQIFGTTPATVTGADYSATHAAGTYRLAIDTPAAFAVAVTDGAGNVLSAPYTQTLTDSNSIAYHVAYTAAAPTGTVRVQQNEAGTVTVNGPTSGIVSGTALYEKVSGTGVYTLSVSTPANRLLVNVTDADGNVLTAPYTQTLAADAVIGYTVTYAPIVTQGTVTVNQNEGGTVTLAGPTAATITDAVYSQPSGTGDYTLTVTPDATHTLTGVASADGNVLTAPYTQTLIEGGTIVYNVTYAAVPHADPAMVSKTVSNDRPAQSSAVTYTVTFMNRGAIAANNVTVTDNYPEASLSNVRSISDARCTDDGSQIVCNIPTLAAGDTVSFTYEADVAGDAAVGVPVVNTAVIAAADNSDRDNDSTSATITPLVRPEVTITKTIDDTDRLLHNGQIATYIVTVTRTNTNVDDTLNLEVTDTLTGTGVLTGANRGRLTTLINNGRCEGSGDGVTCDGDQIDRGPIVIHFPAGVQGASARITYEVQADSVGIPVNGISTFANTVRAHERENRIADIASAPLTVTVAGPVPVITNGIGGSTIAHGNTGGGYTIYRGEMKIGLQKFLSLDGNNFRTADGKPNAIVVPENKVTNLYVKVLIDNTQNGLSASNIVFQHRFDRGSSDMDGTLKNVQGAQLDPTTSRITVDRVMAGKVHEFTYQLEVDEQGQSDQFSTDALTLVSFGSNLPDHQDGLTYVGFGNMITHLFAGRIPASVLEAARQTDTATGAQTTPGTVPGQTGSTAAGVPGLTVRATADIDTPAPGQTVNFTLTAINTGSADLTNMVLVHDFDEKSLKVTRSVGAQNNGYALRWKRAILRPGHTATYRFKAEVTAAAGATIEGVTKTFVDQLEKTNTVVTRLNVAGAAVSGSRAYELAKTGPASILLTLFLSLVLSHFLYQAYEKQRYVFLKKAALQPL